MKVPGWSEQEQAELDDLIKRKEIVTEMFLRPIRNDLSSLLIEFDQAQEIADCLIGKATTVCQILQPLLGRKL